MLSDMFTEDPQGRSLRSFEGLIGAEVASARIEAALLQDPLVASLWRAEAAITEAAASIGLEDIRISEHDLLLRVASNGTAEVEARAAEDALDVLRFLRAPGDALRDPVEMTDRIARLARRGDQDTAEAGEAIILSPAEAQVVFSFCRGRSPILEAILAAGHYACLTERASPVAERMIFVAAEQAARAKAGGASRMTHQADVLRGLGGRIDAGWIAMPASALSSGRFRIWSPAGLKGVRDLLDAISAFQTREVGRLITTREWVRKMGEIGEGQHGRSRIGDAARAFALEPVLTSARLAEVLGVTQRGALNLIDRLVDAGLIRELTHRRAARIWATPMLAEKLGGFAVANSNDRWLGERRARRQEALRAEPAEVDFGAAMEDFDKTMNEADAILERLATRR